MIAALIGFLLALAESGLGLGAVLPGEVAISALASGLDGAPALTIFGLGVALGATTGDHMGFLIGRHGGSRLRDSKIIARLGVDRWDRAADFIQRHGFWALLASRLLPVVRTVMPFAAGAAGMRYRSFLLASVLGALTWASLWAGAGAGLAASGILSRPELIVAVLAGVLLLTAAHRLLLRLNQVMTFVIATP